MNEFLFEFSNRLENKKYEKEFAEAKKIERLLLQKPSFVNGGGVNIKKYQFENNTTEMIRTIETDIRDNLQKYLPDIHVNQIQIAPQDDKTLLIGFNIGIDRSFIFGVSIPENASLESQLIY